MPTIYEILDLAVSAGGLCISGLGFLALLVTILFLRREAREIATTTKEQTLDGLRSQLFDINRIFLENPDLRPYFYEGKVFLKSRRNSLLEQRLKVVSENLLDAFEIVVLHHKHFQPIWEKES